MQRGSLCDLIQCPLALSYQEPNLVISLVSCLTGLYFSTPKWISFCKPFYAFLSCLSPRPQVWHKFLKFILSHNPASARLLIPVKCNQVRQATGGFRWVSFNCSQPGPDCPCFSSAFSLSHFLQHTQGKEPTGDCFLFCPSSTHLSLSSSLALSPSLKAAHKDISLESMGKTILLQIPPTPIYLTSSRTWGFDFQKLPAIHDLKPMNC